MLKSLLKTTGSILYGDLLTAVRDDRPEQVAYLLRMDEEPDSLSGYSQHTPLQTAIIFSRMECAILLLQHKANPNLTSKLWKQGTALHFVVEARKMSFIRLLLFFDADQTIKNQFGQEVTHPHISNKDVNEFIQTISRKVTFLKKALIQADQCFAKKNYHEAIENYMVVANIFETQAQEELEGTYDVLYENSKKLDNKTLIDYFYKNTFRYYQSADSAYHKLIKQKALDGEERKNYLNLLEKIILLCKKIHCPQASYASTMAQLMMQEKITTEKEKQFLSDTLPCGNVINHQGSSAESEGPFNVFANFSVSLDKPSYQEKSSYELKKRKGFVVSESVYHSNINEEKKPLLLNK